MILVLLLLFSFQGFSQTKYETNMFANKHKPMKIANMEFHPTLIKKLFKDEKQFRIRVKDVPPLALSFVDSFEIPREGQSIDVNEIYLNINNEYLNSRQGNDYYMEIRWVALFGYSISPLNDLEVGIDYRLDSFINGNSTNRIWLSLNFFHFLENK